MALLHVEGDAVQGQARGIALADVPQLEGECFHELQPSFRSFLRSPEISA